jgi:hypothetical protein
MTLGLFAAPGHAGNGMINNLNEPGAILVYPLIDNIHGVTIVNVANTSSDPQILECYMVTHGIDGTIDEKKDFLIYLSPKEKFVWLTNNPIDKTVKGKKTQIQGFDNRKGYMFCYTIDNPYAQNEGCTRNGEVYQDQMCNVFKGDATLIDPGNARAWNYNAIPHQRLPHLLSKEEALSSDRDGERILNLDGHEYTMATSQIMFQGLAEVHGSIYGTLAVASPGLAVYEDVVCPPTAADCDEWSVLVESDYDFILSEQPDFDINVFCWNEVETKFSRHLKFKDFEQYDLTKDLQLDIASIFTLGFHCATTSTHPLWAVFHQNLGQVFGWGGNVFQQPGTGVPAAIILPDVPVQ